VNAWQGGSDSGKISTHCRESPKSPSWGLLGEGRSLYGCCHAVPTFCPPQKCGRLDHHAVAFRIEIWYTLAKGGVDKIRWFNWLAFRRVFDRTVHMPLDILILQ
jgi:hypothetical protein